MPIRRDNGRSAKKGIDMNNLTKWIHSKTSIPFEVLQAYLQTSEMAKPKQIEVNV
jgi:hypothetical protein